MVIIIINDINNIYHCEMNGTKNKKAMVWIRRRFAAQDQAQGQG